MEIALISIPILIIIICFFIIICSLIIFLLKSKEKEDVNNIDLKEQKEKEDELEEQELEEKEQVMRRYRKSGYVFDPYAEVWSVDNAGFMCEAAAVVYYDEDICKEWAISNGFTEKFYFMDSSKLDKDTGTQGFVAQSPDAILISFRGTEWTALPDILADIKAIERVSWNNLGKVHKGFFDAFFHVWGKVFDGFQVLPQIFKDMGQRKIWITGHSLGAAIAQFCAIQTELIQGIPIHAIYTFGQPRIGDKQFAENINKKIGDKVFRIVNNRDIVPKMAPFTIGYFQYGREYFFDDKGKFSSKNAFVENLADALKTFIFSTKGLVSFQELLKTTFNEGFDSLANMEKNVNLSNMVNNHAKELLDHFIESGYMPKIQANIL